MRGHGEKLSRKQEQAIAALLTETTIPGAAEKAGVGEATLYRWLQLPEFKAAFRATRRDVVEKATAQIQQNSWAASTTLLKLLGSPSDSIRLRAAVAILDHANKGVETLDFEERLAAVERQAAEELERRGPEQGQAMRLGARLGLVERLLNQRPTQQRGIKVLWPSELSPCPQHEGCWVEISTGEHLNDVIQLSWGTRE